MGLIDTLLGNNTNLGDRDIAFDMLKDSKFGLSGLTMAITETTSPQLRQMLVSQWNSCVTQHHRLADIAIQKDWYQAYAQPMDQLQKDAQDAQNAIR